MKIIFKSYTIYGIISLLLFWVRTKFLFLNARIIRFPFRIRGKQYISVDKNFTAGFNCRIDAFPRSSSVNNKIIVIGKNVQINDYVHIAAIEGVTIEDNVLIASKVFISDHNHGKYSDRNCDAPETIPIERKLVSKKIVIKKNVWIGEFVTILPGVTIGEGSVIGSMSVVNKNIPPKSIAVGAPAKVVKVFNNEKKIWEKV